MRLFLLVYSYTTRDFNRAGPICKDKRESIWVSNTVKKVRLVFVCDFLLQVEGLEVVFERDVAAPGHVFGAEAD